MRLSLVFIRLHLMEHFFWRLLDSAHDYAFVSCQVDWQPHAYPLCRTDDSKSWHHSFCYSWDSQAGIPLGTQTHSQSYSLLYYRSSLHHQTLATGHYSARYSHTGPSQAQQHPESLHCYYCSLLHLSSPLATPRSLRRISRHYLDASFDLSEVFTQLARSLTVARGSLSGACH